MPVTDPGTTGLPACVRMSTSVCWVIAKPPFKEFAIWRFPMEVRRVFHHCCSLFGNMCASRVERSEVLP